MAKNLQVNLAFTADTTAALSNLQKLRKSLTEISALPLQLGKNNLNSDIQKAARSAQQLQQHLGAAMDIKTGNLNLNKLESSLKSSNTSLSTLTTNLLHAGTAGEQAFLSTYSAIAQSNMQLKQANGLATQFMTTLKNTLKWQLSSSLIHGVISGFQDAIGYAKDLDKSLNNIRIVTQNSTEHMARFAEQANKAAKILKTTTTAYTDAALIYYQQGLKDDQVAQRTQTTIKLANITGESADTVSQWMTAIWNNFDDGSKSLEYYADVMTALGAATASSSEEIATGLEKFAAVANTVGLSYENATAALATITATTRQSADVVGTALKTLFARIQDLDLGKTLEDGTDLGSYSENLKKVGIDVKTASGDLKDMDTILAEMGKKWQYLDNAQQVALAKGVAGIRQYTQLIALMDNYDFYEANQAIAKSSEGTLQTQQEIYEESWAAASKRLKASVEDVYDSLIPKDFIIDFTNGLATVVDGLANVLDSFGGIKTIMLLLSTMILTKFEANIAQAFNTGIDKAKTLVQNLQQIRKDGFGGIISRIKDKGKELNQSDAQRTKSHLDDRTDIQKEYTKGLNKALKMKDAQGNQIPLSEDFKAQISNLQTIDKYNVRLLNLQNKMTAAEREQLSAQLQQIKALGDEEVALKKKTSELDTQALKLKEQGGLTLSSRSFKDEGNLKAKTSDYALTNEEIEGFTRAAQAAGAVEVNADDSSQTTKYDNIADAKKASEESLEIVRKTAQAEQEAINLQQSKVNLNKQDLQAKIQSLGLSKEQTDYLLQNVNTTEDLVQATGNLSKGAQIYAASMKNNPSVIADMAANGREYANTLNSVNTIASQQNTILGNLKKNIKDIANRGRTMGNTLVTSLSGLGQAAMGINMLTSAFATLSDQMKNNEVTFGSVLTFISSLGMALPILVKSLSTLTKTFNSENLILLANNIIKWENNRLSKKAAETSGEEAVANKAEAKTLKELNDQELINLGLKRGDKGHIYQPGKRGSVSGNTLVSDFTNSGANAGGKVATEAGGKAATQGGGQALVKTGGQALAKIGPYAAVIAAAIAVLATGITLTVKAFNKHKTEAEKAKKNAKALKDEYQGVVEASNQLNDNISKYNELSDKTKDLVKGTYEYKKALLESNEAAMELIKSNKVLQQPGSYEIVNGKIEINEKALEEAQEKQLQAQQDALARSNMAELDAKQAEYNKNKVETLRDVDSGHITEYNESANYAAVAGGAVGIGGGLLAAGAVNGWNPVGWGLLIAGAATVIGATIAGAVTGDETEKENEAIEHLAEVYEDQPDMFKDKETLKDALGPEYEHLADALWEEKDSVEELVKSNHELLLQEELLTQQIAQATVDKLFGDNIDTRQKDAVTTATTGIMKSDEVKENEDDLYEEIKGQDGLLEDLWNYFNEDSGKTVENKTDDKAVITDKDGNTTDTTQSAIAKSVSASMAQAAASGDAEALEKINSIIKNAANVSEGNEEDIDALMEKLNITDEIKEAAEEVAKQSATLDTISQFSGNTNQSTHSEMLNAIQIGKKDIEDTDFSFLTREELGALQNNLSAFDKDTQKIISQGIATYEEKLIQANAEASAAFESDMYEAEERTSVITKAGINDAEFEAFAETIASTYGIAEEQAEELAEANLRIKNGLTDLKKVYKDYGDYLDKSQKGTLNYSKGIAKVGKSLKDWFGVEFDTKTIEDNLPDIEKALAGDLEAIQRLQDLAAKEFIIKMDLDKTSTDKVNGFIDDLKKENIEVGMSLDTSEAGAKLAEFYNEMIRAGKMSNEEAQKSLELLGYEVEMQKEVAGGNWFTKGWNKLTGKTIETIDIKSTKYKGKASDQAIDYMPEESETPSEKKERIKGYQDEINAYRRLNELSEDLSRAMTNLSEAKNAAYGGKYLALLEQEIAGLEAENDLLDKTISLANERAASHKSELSSKYGIEFDEFGNMSNYNQIQSQYLNRLANMDINSDAYKKKKQEYDDFISLAEDYQEDLDKSEEATDKKASNMRAILDKKLEGIQYEIDIKIEVSEGRLKVLERLLNKLDDDAYDGAARVINYQQQADQYIEQQNSAKKGITDTLKENNVSDEDIQAYLNGDGEVLKKYNLGSSTIDQLTTLTDQFTSAQDGLNDIEEQVKNELMITFNAWHDKIEDIGTSLQNYQSIMENYKNIVDTIGMEKLGLSEKDIRNMEEATQKTLDAQVANAKAQMNTTKAALEDVQSKKAKATSREEYEYWEEQEKALSRQLEEDTANATSLWASAIENAYTTFDEQTKRAIEAFEDSLAGANFGSLDELQASIDKQNQASERYLSNYEKAYELSKLNRNIQKEMDKIDDPRKKQALAELQEEIAEKTAAGVKMSENDLRYLQQKYDLKVAEIALEDAQNAKSQVRLRKDANGNFNYVYTADENKTADAEQKYEDAMYNMEKSNEEYLNNLQEQIVSNRQAMVAELSELNIQDYANAEEYEAAKAKIIEFYTAQEAYYMQEMQKQFDYNKEHYDQDVVFYSDYNQQKTGIYGQDQVAYNSYVIDKKDKDKQIIDSFGEIVLGMETGFSDIQGYHSAFLTAIGTAGENGKGGSGLLGDMGTAYNTLDSTINDLAETFNITLGANGDAQKDMTSFKNHVNTVMYGKGGSKDKPSGGVVGATNAAESATKTYEQTAKSKFGSVSTAVTTWYSIYGPKVQQGEQDTIDLNTALNNLKSVSLTVDTEVNGKSEVEQLEQAIRDLQEAITGLSNKTFTITADIKTNGSYDTNDNDQSQHTQYSYKIGEASEKAANAGYTRLEDSNGKYVGYTKTSGVSFNATNDMGNTTETIYDYLIYDANGEVVEGVAQGKTFTSHSVSGDRDIDICSFDEGNYKDGTDNLHEAMRTRAGYIIVNNTRYYAFRFKNKDYQKQTGWYFAPIGSIIDDFGSTKPQLNGSAKFYSFVGYDTGGYTGEWGSDGRMAILHQKEIVLNAHDTENFLKAIEIVRGISNRLDQQASMMSMGLSNVFANIMTPKEKSDTLQQEVHITAEFPNATNHSEIEEAFRNLPNLASQYIYRK